ncbi:sigma-70 family RNA polymerase sigma factor [Siminovitchia sediminis]|uniref:Sigma-70 family RNA polymerase sigma factor n=1 Tax=Siminovitchia sediminis TaxID=1274353 RepID=A0ABW4KLD8_9BACI
MEDFTELAKQYKPMIYHIIRSLHIYKNEEEFEQTALIALWEARERFHPDKGRFSAYAYSYMKGRMMTELTKHSKEENLAYPDEDFWEVQEDQHREQPLELETLLSYCEGLTEKQKHWVIFTFYYGQTVKEIAEEKKVSESAVKKWRSGAIKKIRRNMKGNSVH